MDWGSVIGSALGAFIAYWIGFAAGRRFSGPVLKELRARAERVEGHPMVTEYVRRVLK